MPVSWKVFNLCEDIFMWRQISFQLLDLSDSFIVDTVYPMKYTLIL